MLQSTFEPRNSRQALTLVLLASLVWLFATNASAHYRSYNVSGIEESHYLLNQWKKTSLSHKEIREWAIDPNGEWVIITEDNVVYFSPGLPFEVRNLVMAWAPFGIDVIAFDPNGEFVITAGSMNYLSSGVPERSRLQLAVIAGINNNGGRLTDLAFTADGNGWIVISGDSSTYFACPSDLAEAVREAQQVSHREITSVAIGTDGRWALVADHWFASSDLSSFALSSLQSALRDGRDISNVAIGPGNGFLLYSGETFEASNAMERLEMDLDGENIYQRMYDGNIAGISLAVIDDNEIKYARGYGVLEAGTDEWVRTSSPFDLASLSKYLGALTLMTLVEDYELYLASDAYVMAQEPGSLLKAWDDGTGNTAVPGLLLARLLSHTAGVVPGSSTSVDESAWPSNGISTLDLLLGAEGEDSNGNLLYDTDQEVWSSSSPGTTYEYSGGGYLLAEAMAEQATGEEFADLMQERVFDALGMEDTTAHQKLSAAFEARASEMHDASGAVQDRPIYPWRSAGGVYSSAADYARAMIVLMRGGKDENGDRLIEQSTTNTMLTDWTPAQSGYGLGVFVASGGGSDWFGHGGSHTDLTTTMMMADGDRGIVILVNGDSSDIDDLRDDIYQTFFSEF